MHKLFWKGKIERDEDAPWPVQVLAGWYDQGATIRRNIRHRIFGEGVEDAYTFEPVLKRKLDAAEEKFAAIPDDSRQELSWQALYNFFADPEPSFRNLILNTGFISFQLLLWFLPTFWWPGENLPTPATTRLGEDGPEVDADFSQRIKDLEGLEGADERVLQLIYHLSNSSPSAFYNRMMCPQCIAQNLSIFLLGVTLCNGTAQQTFLHFQFSGKILFWWFFTSLPDFGPFFIKPTLREASTEASEPLSSPYYSTNQPRSMLSASPFGFSALVDNAAGELLAMAKVKTALVAAGVLQDYT